MPEIDFVLSNYGEFGWGVTSPQIPGLIAGMQELDDITVGYLTELASVAGVPVDDGFMVHIDEVVMVDDAIFRVRARQMPLASYLLGPAQATVRGLVASDAAYREVATPDAFGDRCFVVSLPSDTVESAARSLEPGSPFVAAVREPDGIILTPLAPAPTTLAPRGASRSHGLVTRDMTFAQVITVHDSAVTSRRQLQFA